jgi:DNA-binding CsgD family transcriptional regulator
VNVDSTALGLIDLLYQGLEDRAAFDAFAKNLALAVGANAVALSLDLDPGPHTPLSTFGMDPGFLKLYEEHYDSVNVHRTEGTRLFTPGAVLSSEETCPDRVLLSSEYYNDFLRPQKLCHVFGAILHHSSQNSSMLGVYPARHSDSFNDENVSLIRALVPHLQRLNRMGSQIGAAQVGTQALNHFHTGVVIVSASGKVLLMNTIAERIVGRSDGLSWCGGMLRATQPREDAKLKLAIRAVCAMEKPSTDNSCKVATSFALSRRSGSQPYQITIERFLNKPAGIFTRAAILFVSDLEDALQIPEKTLAQFYGLTAAEARLANLLLKGNDLTEACAVLHVRRNTGRAHLRSIFDKLGVRSQSQLVALLARSLAAGLQRVE